MRLCRFVGISREAGSTRQPSHTKPCQCVSGQPWACHGPLEDQMHPVVQWSAGLVEPARGAVLGCAGRLLYLRFCHILESFSDGACARQPLRTEPCQCVSGQPWACPGPLQGQMHPVQLSAGLVEPALGAVLGCAGRLCGLRFCHIVESFSDGSCALQQLRTEPCQCVSGQPWACHGAL